ncbi:hypothetical protein V7x_13480 [Crateriforma conspicua]|uniref:Uncharacterized protein n=1 Tax=Crateriforma conspicua TaxID=2527996 RepID=A0A5C6FVY2_9PLAN|nr:hypothetical protein V7x_13480 [Crateriforma conspicua]
MKRAERTDRGIGTPMPEPRRRSIRLPTPDSVRIRSGGLGRPARTRACDEENAGFEHDMIHQMVSA